MTGHTRLNLFRFALPGITAFAACAAGFLVLVASPAGASVCEDLRTELRTLSRAGPGGSSQAQRFADAAARQARELQKTRAIQRQNGCFGDPSAGCQALYRTIEEMRANLAMLESQRDKLSRGRNGARIRAIEMRLASNRCDEPQRTARTQPRDNRVAVVPEPVRKSERKTRVVVRQGVGREIIYDRPIEGETNRALPAEPTDTTGPNRITIGYMPGTYRTLCVRTCDGYYFPISFSTRFDYFGRDAKVCEARCPGTETKLYFHRVPEQESEEMISLQGQPYTVLPNAFLYRQRKTDKADPSCGCGAPLVAPQSPQTPVPDKLELSAVPTPVERPEIVEKTGTAPKAADAPKAPTEEKSAGAESSDANRRIRVVGPGFLPAPEEAEGPRSPDPKSDR